MTILPRESVSICLCGAMTHPLCHTREEYFDEFHVSGDMLSSQNAGQSSVQRGSLKTINTRKLQSGL